MISLISCEVGRPGFDWTRMMSSCPSRPRSFWSVGRSNTASVALPIETPGSSFQQRVWRALQDIPYGETISYGELARRIGVPSAARAVGVANHHNPVSIVIPCHRVIGADGSLTGYGGGLERKRLLLDLESGVASLGLADPQNQFPSRVA